MEPGSAKRVLVVVAVLALTVALLSSDAVFGLLQRAVGAFQPFLAAHPRLSAVVFTLLSALSAMLAFFSSAALVPIAVRHWGPPATALLLWLGWLLGGLTSYALARTLGRPLLRALRADRKVMRHAGALSARATFPLLLLVQLALPSEIPGYLAGVLRVPLRRYLPALALAEIPFAVGTVLLGDSVLERRALLLVAISAGGVLLSLVAAHVLQRRIDHGDGMRPFARG